MTRISRQEPEPVSPNDRDNQIRKWSERAEIARKYGQNELESAALVLKSICEKLVTGEVQEPPTLTKANLLRKQIEAAEQHRTMCVEHGLSDAAIDATYEIQELEKQVVVLVSTMV